MTLTSGVNGLHDDPQQPPEEIWTVRAAAASGEGVVEVDLTVVREIQRAVNVAMSEQERRTNGAAMPPDAQRQLAMKLISREIDDRSVARGMQGHELAPHSHRVARGNEPAHFDLQPFE